MTIIATELQAYKSQVVTNDSTNGGRMSNNQIISGVLQNVFPHVFSNDRQAGLTTRRKLFFKVANDADETLNNPAVCLDGPTSGEDWVFFHVGTQRDTQNDITGSERKYVAGVTTAQASAGGSTLVVDVEDSSLTNGFLDADTIRVTDKLTPDSGTGNEEEHTISGTPSVSGTEVTITISGTLANTYAAGAKVSSKYVPSDIACSVDNWSESAAGDGTYDETTNPVDCDNIGTIEQTWTLTFTDATNFTVEGDVEGSVGSGNTSTDFSPENSDFSKPYFTLAAAGWAGTWAANDTITFQTHPAAVTIWEIREVPAGAASMANNSVTAIFSGESA